MEGMTCNIKREGAMRRYRISIFLFIIGVALTYGFNVYHVQNWSSRLVLLPIFQAALTSGIQAPARTCFVNAALGVDENEKFKLKPIASLERVLALRLRAAGMMFVSSAVGLVIALVAMLSSRVSFECSDHTCSLFLS
jgi:hypothetical protein